MSEIKRGNKDNKYIEGNILKIVYETKIKNIENSIPFL